MQILVAGLAKTGTTGLLYLVKNSLASNPKVLFEPKSCDAQVFAEHPELLVKVIVDAQLDAESLKPFGHKITIVRDPRDRLVSALLYGQFHASYLADDAKVSQIRDMLERKERSPASVSIASILETLAHVGGKPVRAAVHAERIDRVLHIFDRYCQATPDALLYKYEDFVDGNYAPLEGHLGLQIAGEAVVPDALRRVERTKGHGDWRHWFTTEDVELFRPVIGPWLARHGYDADDWRLEDPQVIDPKHCSLYFMRLVDEWRAKPHRQERAAGAPPVAAAGAAAVKRAAPPARHKHNDGAVVRADTKTITGWAVGADSAEPVTLALSVNGREVAQTVADKPRPALVERGLHPTGRCGFVFTLRGAEALRAGDEIVVTPVGAQFTLKNSPRTIVDGTVT